MIAKFTVRALLLLAVLSIVSGELADTKYAPVEFKDRAQVLERTGTLVGDERELQDSDPVVVVFGNQDRVRIQGLRGENPGLVAYSSGDGRRGAYRGYITYGSSRSSGGPQDSDPVIIVVSDQEHSTPRSSGLEFNKLPSTVGFQTAAAQGSSPTEQNTIQRNRGSSLFEDYHDDDDMVPAGSRSSYFAYTTGGTIDGGDATFSAQQGTSAQASAQGQYSGQRDSGSSLFEDYHSDDDIVPAGGRSDYFATIGEGFPSYSEQGGEASGGTRGYRARADGEGV